MRELVHIVLRQPLYLLSADSQCRSPIQEDLEVLSSTSIEGFKGRVERPIVTGDRITGTRPRKACAGPRQGRLAVVAVGARVPPPGR